MLKDIKRIHFIGIGGYGMSALAHAMLNLGYHVTGSDLKQSEITEKLVLNGAAVIYRHHADNIGDAELVVYSTAIRQDNPEIVEAKKRNLPLWHRSELLAHFLNSRFGIAVAGAHGKTTTTSMISLVLTQGGLDPTAFIGGVLADFDGNARVGASRFLVAEACESDHSFLRYHPDIAVVTNIEPDHLEHYNGDFSLLLDAYRSFLNNIKPGGCTVLFADDLYLADMHPAQAATVITYGRNSNADLQAVDIEPAGWGSSFTVLKNGKTLGRVNLQVPGSHNVENALAAIAVALHIGLPFARIKEGLEQFHGAKRRFQFLLQKNGIAVVDDYAHHPTEVRATLQAAKYGKPRRVIAVFQPHRYNRTMLFMDEFARSFTGADKVFLHKIYPAGEAPIPGVTSRELARRISAHGTDVTRLDDAADIVREVAAMARPGDLVICMGAGDITDIARTIAREIGEEKHEDR